MRVIVVVGERFKQLDEYIQTQNPAPRSVEFRAYTDPAKLASYGHGQEVVLVGPWFNGAVRHEFDQVVEKRFMRAKEA